MFWGKMFCGNLFFRIAAKIRNRTRYTNAKKSRDGGFHFSRGCYNQLVMWLTMS